MGNPSSVSLSHSGGNSPPHSKSHPWVPIRRLYQKNHVSYINNEESTSGKERYSQVVICGVKRKRLSLYPEGSPSCHLLSLASPPYCKSLLREAREEVAMRDMDFPAAQIAGGHLIVPSQFKGRTVGWHLLEILLVTGRSFLHKAAGSWPQWAAPSPRKLTLKMGRNKLPHISYPLILVLEKHRGVLKPCSISCFLCTPVHLYCGPKAHIPLLFL